MTNTPLSTTSADRVKAWPATHKVVIVNGSPNMAGQFESVLNGGHYDIVFVESSAHAYSQIKRVQPELVVLCVQTDGDGLQVLSMLKLDHETRGIPVVTCTIEHSAPEPQEDDEDEAPEAPLFLARKPPALLMN